MIYDTGIYANLMTLLVIPTRFERVTPRLGIWCSILLSYGTIKPSIQKCGRFAKSFSKGDEK